MYTGIKTLFEKYPQIIYGFSSIEWLHNISYRRALVFGVPHTEHLTYECWQEEKLHTLLIEALETVRLIHTDLETFFNQNTVRYSFPSPIQDSEETLTAPFSFKHFAVQAGLGWIGKNDLFISHIHGPRILLSAVFIDEDLPAGIPIQNSLCPINCSACVNACPCHALTGIQWHIHTERGEIIDYHLCNQKRSLSIKSQGRKHECGLCMVSCPIGL